MPKELITEKKIIVTGAAGFIGSHLVDTLLETGNEVLGIDNFSTGRESNLVTASKHVQFKLVRGDIRDANFLLEQFRGVDCVFHEAAFTSVPQSIKKPLVCNQVNIEGVLNVLEAARQDDVKKVVFASSSEVYGDSPVLPKQEDMPLVPISPYGVSKLAGEMYFRTYHKVYGLNTTCLRYFNVFGPRQYDSPYSGVIAIFFGKIARKEPLLIYGDGTQSRDFAYVKDVVKANILAATQSKLAGEVFNIAGGTPISLTGLAKTMLEVTDHANLEIKYYPPRAGDILHSYADLAKARALLLFKPKYSLKTGLEDYITYLDENLQEK